MSLKMLFTLTWFPHWCIFFFCAFIIIPLATGFQQLQQVEILPDIVIKYVLNKNLYSSMLRFVEDQMFYDWKQLSTIVKSTSLYCIENFVAVLHVLEITEQFFILEIVNCLMHWKK